MVLQFVGEYVAAFFIGTPILIDWGSFFSVRDGSENPLRSKECSEQPDPQGHAQKNIKKQQPFQTAVNEIIIGFFYNLNASFTTST